MADPGIACSMSRAGAVWDSSAMERFLSSLTAERTVHKVCRTRDTARADVLDHIERVHNPTRRHSALDGLSPVELKRQAVLP